MNEQKKAAQRIAGQDFVRGVIAELRRVTWPTREVAGAAWRAHGSVALVGDREEAIELADELAPEHLELQVAELVRSW